MVENLNREISCKKCSNKFVKTKNTGNQCYDCRRNNRVYKYKSCLCCGSEYTKEKSSPYCWSCMKTKYPDTMISIARRKRVKDDDKSHVLHFVNKIERHGGYLYTLEDMSQLIECWQTIVPSKQYKYDAYNAGYQLHFMWRDLKNWKKKYALS